ncbi:MAG TPA: O-antigen ligase family protein [Polyangiales bacterium]|nr:O-antigen ligase family protein [Polyangiales bacterium]
MARYVTYALVWLALTAEVEGYIFHGLWSTWLTFVGTIVFKTIPLIKIVPWDLATVLVLLTSTLPKKGSLLEVRKSILLCFTGMFALWFWGILRGGSAYQTLFQTHSFLVQLLLALAVMTTCKTRAHVRMLGIVIVSAAVYRAGVLFTFYLSVAQYLPEKLPTLTDHADSVLFVVGLFIVLLNALERRTPDAMLCAVLMTAVMFTAMVMNNRRIAWLDVGAGFAATYLLMPKGPLKKRMTIALTAMSPLLVAYIAIGWGSPTGIFKPVGSISTMFGDNQDPSSIMRDIENYNLLRTLKGNPLLGSGWGHEYVEEVVAYSIADIFPQYRFLPHNSLLGIVAFTGLIGFTMIWQFVMVSNYMLARVCFESKDKVLRVAAHASLIAVITVIVQFWGDVGFNHLGVNCVLAVTVGLAGRLPLLAKIWPLPPPRTSDARNDVQDRKDPERTEPSPPLADFA